MALPDDGADKLIAVQKAGEEMLRELVEVQVIKYTKGFFTTNHKSMLQTLEALSKMIIVSDGGKRSTMTAGADLFQHMIAVEQNLKNNLK